MKTSLTHDEAVDRSQTAAYLSILPGLGHLYKHHYLSGALILVGGNLLAAFVTAWLALATFGVALVVVPVLWVAAMAASAYHLEDWHGHHHPRFDRSPRKSEGQPPGD